MKDSSIDYTGIVKGNGLIACFMGAICDDGIYIFDRNNVVTRYEVLALKYYDSYDWLMEVVEKIEKQGFEITIKNGNVLFYKTTKFKIYCGFPKKTQEEVGTCGELVYKYISASSKHQALWKCVVEYIKWFNRNYGKV